MPRVKRGVTASKRRKKVLKRAKGYIYGRSKKYRAAKEATIKAGQHSYRDRRRKKRDARSLWIIRINAGCKRNDISYSKFIAALKKNKIELDRKVLAELALKYPKTFSALIKEVTK